MSNLETADLEAFLRWEPHQALRHEYVGGDVRALAGAGRRHETAALTIVTQLAIHLRGTPCSVFKGDFAVRLALTHSYYYPDINVSCDPRDTDERANRHPKLVIEVLSAATADIDLGEKRRNYQTIAELEEYVVVDPVAISARAWRRDSAGAWTELDAISGECLRLASVDLAVDLGALRTTVQQGPSHTPDP